MVASNSDRGFVLPAVLVVLLGLMLFLVGGYHASRLDLLAARSLAGTVRAFYAAEAGLALLEVGGGPGIDSTTLRNVRLELRIDTLRAAVEGGVVLWHRARAETRDPVGRLSGRREIGRLWLAGPGGEPSPIAGGWRETIRIEGP